MDIVRLCVKQVILFSLAELALFVATRTGVVLMCFLQNSQQIPRKDKNQERFSPPVGSF